jgi:phosphatidylglycerol---prolipoprotein diacylglyceryl transferase
MLPYYPQPVFQLGPLSIHAFGALGALAVLVGYWIILLRARRFGIPLEEMFQLTCSLYLCALVGAFFSKTIFADPQAFLADPGRVFRVGLGIRSVGGIAGGFLGGLLWCVFRRLSMYETLRRLDVIAYAIPFGWMIGRLGCTLAHDHRGLASSSWIAVKFPEGPRYDLGLIEFLFLIGMVLAFHLLDRKPRPVGFYFGLYGVVYGAFRIWLDTLHIQPLRFYGGTVAVVVGLAGWAAMWAFARSRTEQAEATPATA